VDLVVVADDRTTWRPRRRTYRARRLPPVARAGARALPDGASGRAAPAL